MHILKVALPLPLRRSFDYSIDKNISLQELKPGMRVLVPFGKNRKVIGMLTSTSSQSDIAQSKIKSILSVVDNTPVLSIVDLKLLEWTADYYHYPIGEVIFNSLPAFLKQGKPAELNKTMNWCLSESGRNHDPETLKRAPKQLAVFNILSTYSMGLSTIEIEEKLLNSRAPLMALLKKGLVEKIEAPNKFHSPSFNNDDIQLGSEQVQASNKVIESLGKKQVFLLDGVTGRGKTEVYIEIMQTLVAQKKQVLILSPEIGLAPQLLKRIASRINVKIAVFHSGLSDTERLQAWLDAKSGKAAIVIGTRSAIWTPLKNPGLFIVDEEHDLSYKQQEGLRYSARDIAIMRGSLSNSPVLLGSATPSAESLRNVELQKFQLLNLNKRAGEAKIPKVKIVDLRNRAMLGAVSQTLLDAVKKELSKHNQVMLFLNRRGYSPTIMCHQCAWIADCERCDMHMTYHKHRNILSCHHCGQERKLTSTCPDCNSDKLVEIGHGTERLKETLADCFPTVNILRIDRDSTRRKGSMETMINSIESGDADILIGTQMLAKGHHFPKLTLVGIIDADSGLCSTDFRASERMAQLFVQVSGRAGREKKAGTVMIQTHYPDHPLLNTLINHGYREFSKLLLREREEANLPPFSFLALLRSESHNRNVARDFLQEARVLIKHEEHQLEIYGPIPAPIEKRAGKIRMQLLVSSGNRASLRNLMQSWSLKIENLTTAKKVRWSLDIDPQDMM